MDGGTALLSNYKSGNIKENASDTTITEKTSRAYYGCQVCYFLNLLDQFSVTSKKLFIKCLQYEKPELKMLHSLLLSGSA